MRTNFSKPPLIRARLIRCSLKSHLKTVLSIAATFWVTSVTAQITTCQNADASVVYLGSQCDPGNAPTDSAANNNIALEQQERNRIRRQGDYAASQARHSRNITQWERRISYLRDCADKMVRCDLRSIGEALDGMPGDIVESALGDGNKQTDPVYGDNFATFYYALDVVDHGGKMKHMPLIVTVQGIVTKVIRGYSQ